MAHAMSGLLVYYDVFRQPRVLAAVQRLADCVLTELAPGEPACSGQGITMGFRRRRS